MFSSGDSSLSWSQLTVQNVQNERKMVNQPACQAPVVRSVYQADIVTILLTSTALIASSTAFMLSVNLVIFSTVCFGNPRADITRSCPANTHVYLYRGNIGGKKRC